ncbi:hypothetical protein EVAR_86744_1 [Eumeta japonica]|uniref:Uncharacterized protein n=1 Tax=Eumeta variegata TaxID=151549 RepID=A0A4C1W1U3_EUMVA|nr:hypothetical protein EVAR_86744_1 [Eumeta japonica]
MGGPPPPAAARRPALAPRSALWSILFMALPCNPFQIQMTLAGSNKRGRDSREPEQQGVSGKQRATDLWSIHGRVLPPVSATAPCCNRNN